MLLDSLRIDGIILFLGRVAAASLPDLLMSGN